MGPLHFERVNWRSLVLENIDYDWPLPIPSVVTSNFFRNVRMISAVASKATRSSTVTDSL